MSIGPTLFEALTPPQVWVTLHELEHPEADERKVTMRIKPIGRRSSSATVKVSKYSPEGQIIEALGKAYKAIEGAQQYPSAGLIKRCMDDAMVQYVDPF